MYVYSEVNVVIGYTEKVQLLPYNVNIILW